MKFPDKFKIFWWALVTAFTGSLVIMRYHDISIGCATWVDVLILLLFVALLLVPIFSEIELFGIKLKREITELKKDIGLKFSEIGVKIGEIKNEVNTNQSVNVMNNTGGIPWPDNILKNIEKMFDEKMSALNVNTSTPQSGLAVPQKNMNLFKVRFSIENHLRRIWAALTAKADANLFSAPRVYPLGVIIKKLVVRGVLDADVQGLLEQVMAICNNAVHGENVSEQQVQFVNRYADGLIKYLQDVDPEN